MAVNKPQKSVNLDLPDHENASAIAAIMTQRNRQLTSDPNLKPIGIKEAVSYALRSQRKLIEQAYGSEKASAPSGQAQTPPPVPAQPPAARNDSQGVSPEHVTSVANPQPATPPVQTISTPPPAVG